jgi:hypothetical protein
LPRRVLLVRKALVTMLIPKSLSVIFERELSFGSDVLQKLQMASSIRLTKGNSPIQRSYKVAKIDSEIPKALVMLSFLLLAFHLLGDDSDSIFAGF